MREALRRLGALVICTGSALAAPTFAAPPDSGRDLAASCAACHGTEGRASGGFVALAGQPREALVASLKAFRDGSRPASVMHQHAKGYTDDEFERIADWFARQEGAR